MAATRSGSYVNVTVNIYCSLLQSMWAGSSVGIANDYGLDGPEWNPGGDEIFHPSRPVVFPPTLL